MPSVAFASTDWGHLDGEMVPNGCTYYRCVLPAKALHERGWDTGVGAPAVHSVGGLGLAQGDDVLAGWDVTVLKLVMHRDVLPTVNEMVRSGKTIVVDIDDFHPGLSVENVAYKITDPHVNPEVNRAWYEQIMRVSSFVTVSTQFLADYYSARCRDVRLVRNGVDAERYPQRDVSGEPMIGWVGATPWRSQDIETLAGWLPLLVHDTGVKVHHSGHIKHDPQPFHVRAGLPESAVTTSKMIPLPDYPTMLQPFNIGIVPLNRVPFNDAKSTIKGLEYAASGIPFVAEATYEYQRLADMGVGRVASTPDEWRDHIMELMDEQTRIAEGARLREVVAAQHTYEARGDEWATALSG